MDLQGKIALVTGVSRGIGQGIALALAQQGAAVVGTATTVQGAEKISAKFEQENLTGRGLVLNVTEQASIDALMKTIQEELGAPNILVNNAAVTRDNIMLRMKDDEWESIIDTNLSSVYRLSKACLRGMVKARWGRVITIGSVVGSVGNLGQANYAAAKAGLIGFTKSLAQEIGVRGITANVVSPGFIDTDMTRDLPEEQRDILMKKIPLNRLGQPEDIANAVAFLASEKANYITGQTLHVNGGMYMS